MTKGELLIIEEQPRATGGCLYGLIVVCGIIGAFICMIYGAAMITLNVINALLPYFK
jgi:hypothetical protein